MEKKTIKNIHRKMNVDENILLIELFIISIEINKK